MSYIFDVFPIRPQPQPLEALSSYLSRLAAANSIRASCTFLNWCLPNVVRTAHNITDIFMKDWDGLPSASALPIADLQAMTLFNIGLWFGRPYCTASNNPLKNCVIRHFRYCPRCLAEQGYASLLWRLKPLVGCARHNIMLHDTCPHCAQRLLAMRTTPLDRCPKCGADLCDTPTQALCVDDIALARVRTADLCALLQTPVPGSLNISWQAIREAKGITPAEMARALHCPQAWIKSMEHGARPLNLHHLFQYCDRLGVSIRDILLPETVQSAERDVITRATAASQRAMETDAARYEAQLLDHVPMLSERPRHDGVSTTLESLSHELGLNSTELTSYPELRRQLDRVRQQHRARHKQMLEAEWLAKIEPFTNLLLESGEPFSSGEICQALGTTLDVLRRYPAVSQILDDLLAIGQRRRQRKQYALLAELDATCEKLKANGTVVTQRALQEAGLSLEQLNTYVITRRRLADIPKKLSPPKQQAATRQAEQDACERVHAVLPEQLQRPMRLTLVAVALAADVSPSFIQQHPNLLATVNDAIAKTPYFVTYTFDDVKRVVLTTAEALDQDDVSPTLEIVMGQLDWLKWYFSNEPNKRLVIKRLLADYRAQRRQRIREANFKSFIAKVGQHLDRHPDVVSFAQLARDLGCNKDKFVGDPPLHRRIQQAIQGHQERADQLFCQRVQAVIAEWQATGVRVTRKALSEHFGISESCFDKHGTIVALLTGIRQTEQEQRRQYQDDLTQRASQFVQQRRKQGLPVTRLLIADHLGVSGDKLDGYVGTRAIFDSLNAHRLLETAQREAQLLEQVEGAICALKAMGRPVHQKAIAAYLERSPEGLKHYPRIRQRLQEVIQANQK